VLLPEALLVQAQPEPASLARPGQALLREALLREALLREALLRVPASPARTEQALPPGVLLERA